MIKLGLLNIRSLSTKALFVNNMITDHKLDVLSLTETGLKSDEYIILNESTSQDYGYKNQPRPKGKWGGVAKIYSNILSISQKTGFKYSFFEVIQFKIICIALFTIQLLQSNFTGNYVSKIDLYCRNSI